MRRNDLEKVVIGLISSLTYYKYYSFLKRGWISCLKPTAGEVNETFSMSTLISVLSFYSARHTAKEEKLCSIK